MRGRGDCSLLELGPLLGAFNGLVYEDNAIEHDAQYGEGGGGGAEYAHEAGGFFGNFNAPGEVVACAECSAHHGEAHLVAWRGRC